MSHIRRTVNKKDQSDLLFLRKSFISLQIVLVVESLIFSFLGMIYLCLAYLEGIPLGWREIILSSLTGGVFAVKAFIEMYKKVR